MWYALTHHWNFARFIRVGLGVIILIQGFVNHDYGVVAMGGFFTLFGLFTTGCCGMSGCNTETTQLRQNRIEDITFEEVENKK